MVELAAELDKEHSNRSAQKTQAERKPGDRQCQP